MLISAQDVKENYEEHAKLAGDVTTLAEILKERRDRIENATYREVVEDFSRSVMSTSLINCANLRPPVVYRLRKTTPIRGWAPLLSAAWPTQKVTPRTFSQCEGSYM
jgi:hypothetical protein